MRISDKVEATWDGSVLTLFHRFCSSLTSKRLAATIGGKNLNRKLSRRDLLSVNIVEAW